MSNEAMRVKVFPYRKGRSTGNIIWAKRNLGNSYYRFSKFRMIGGRFPSDHPVGGTRCANDPSQLGSGEAIDAFRERGYWASCFPEGDGITWKPLREQTDEQCRKDIQECFGWLIEDGGVE
jgi:hypothetical protein